MNRLKCISINSCVLHAIVAILFIAMCVIACMFYNAMVSYNVCTCCVTSIDTYLEMINGMVGFWMSLLAVILMICGIWQYLHIQKVDGKIKEAEDRMLESEEKYNKKMNEIQCVSDISILLRSIGALNDPIMLLSNNERKRELKNFLSLIVDKLKMLVKTVSSPDTDVNDEKDNLVLSLRIILLNLTLCIGRVQVMYSSPREHLEMREFIKDNNNKRINIDDGKIIEEYKDLIRRMEKLLMIL